MPARSTWRPSWRACSTPPRRSPTRPATSSSPSSACCWRWRWSSRDAGRVLKDAGVNADHAQRGHQRHPQGPHGRQRLRRAGLRRARSAMRATSRQPAAEGKIDPVIGRDEEIRRTIQVLSRRTKNNPVLIGEPGVGKTAIAEGLAPAHRQGRRAREPQGQEAAGARHGRADRRRQVSRRVRGAPEGRAVGGAGRGRAHHPVHRRAAHHRRRRQGRGRDGCRQPAEAGARARRAALRRRHHARRVPQAHREGCRAGAALPAGVRRRAERWRTPSRSCAA